MAAKKAPELPSLGTPGGLKMNFAKAQFFGMKWSKPGVAFLTVGVIAGLYVSDWKVIVNKIPFYKNQFKE